MTRDYLAALPALLKGRRWANVRLDFLEAFSTDAAMEVIDQCLVQGIPKEALHHVAPFTRDACTAALSNMPAVSSYKYKDEFGHFDRPSRITLVNPSRAYNDPAAEYLVPQSLCLTHHRVKRATTKLPAKADLRTGLESRG